MYADLLAQARAGAPRSLFTPYMSDLCDTTKFDDLDRLRLLGNAVANSSENADILINHPETVDRLLEMDPLGLQVLYNATVNNISFSNKLILSKKMLNLKSSCAAKNLMGSIFDNLQSADMKLPRELQIRLILNGFLELIVDDFDLEQSEEILKNFETVFKHAMQCSLSSQDEFNTLGIRVVGNISSHNSFTLDIAKPLIDLEVTWETVALLVNLTAEMKNLSTVLEMWPNCVHDVVELIKSEDPDTDEVEEETPFDLELWGPFMRNVSRDPKAASQINDEYPPLKLYKQLIQYDTTRRVGFDFAIAFSKNVYNRDLVEFIADQEFDDDDKVVGAMLASSVYREEATEFAPKLVKIIEKGLIGAPESVWLRGTKALALMSHVTSVDVEKLKDAAPKNEHVESNLKAVQT